MCSSLLWMAAAIILGNARPNVKLHSQSSKLQFSLSRFIQHVQSVYILLTSLFFEQAVG